MPRVSKQAREPNEGSQRHCSAGRESRAGGGAAQAGAESAHHLRLSAYWKQDSAKPRIDSSVLYIPMPTPAPAAGVQG